MVTGIGGTMLFKKLYHRLYIISNLFYLNEGEAIQRKQYNKGNNYFIVLYHELR